MTQLGSYTIHHRLASGGMAELFLASEQSDPGTLVAIKKVRPEAASDPAVVKMLIDEGRVTQQLAHPGIARTLRTVHEGDELFLVMEFVDGRDVQALQRKLAELGKRLPYGLGALITLRAARALDHAHRRTTPDGRSLQIVHRDISPTNLMVSFGGIVRVIDFGIARAADRLTSTRAGVVKGKLRYMAPEQARGKDLDRRADVYALGLVLYELLSGRRPLSELSDMEFIHRAMRSTVPPVREKHPEVPVQLDAIVAKAMSADRAQRYAWASEMADDLEAWLGTLPARPMEGDLASVMRRLFPGEEGRARALAAQVSAI